MYYIRDSKLIVLIDKLLLSSSVEESNQERQKKKKRLFFFFLSSLSICFSSRIKKNVDLTEIRFVIGMCNRKAIKMYSISMHVIHTLSITYFVLLRRRKIYYYSLYNSKVKVMTTMITYEGS